MGFIAPSIVLESEEGDLLFERFMPGGKNHTIETAPDTLRNCLINQINKRGALTVVRAQQKFAPEELNILMSHVSRDSVEKLFILHLFTAHL